MFQRSLLPPSPGLALMMEASNGIEYKVVLTVFKI
jgi:hypothetical protein